MKNVARFLVSQGLLAGFLVLLACSNVHGDTVVRTLAPNGPDTSGGAFLLAPGYCSSYGGSHLYEYISSVDVVQIGEIMTITVYIWIANPTGCTAGSPCPEYDGSPEYINVWIDWDGDEVWESQEKVMDAALTGYLGINYYGTMTAVAQATIPPDAEEVTWLRANLGWDHDPNNPCEYSWTWGDVHDQQVTVKPTGIRVTQIEISENIRIASVGNPIWQQTCDNVGNPVEKPIADAIFSSQYPREFFLDIELEACSGSMPADLEVECLWAIDSYDPNAGWGSMGIDAFEGPQGTMNLWVPGAVGKYKLNLEFTFKDGSDVLGSQVINLSNFYVILRGEPSDIKGQIYLEKACNWGAGGSDDESVCHALAEGIYAESGWLYRDNALPLRWVELVNDQASEGNCVDFANVWDFLCRVLGLNGTRPDDQHFGAYGWGFVTYANNSSMDGLPGNAYKLGSSYGSRDRWSFGMHQVGRRGIWLYDATFGKRYLHHSDYVEWNNTVCVNNPAFGVLRVCSAEATGNEYYYLYLTFANYLMWTIGLHPWLTDIYDGPYASAPEVPCDEGGPLLASLSPLSTGGAIGSDPAFFLGNCSDSAIDSDGDGIANVLGVWTDIELAKADTFLVLATLYADDEMVTARSSMNLSTFAVGDFVVDSGTNTMMFEFSGEDIWRSGQDGPYQVKFVLVDTSSAFLDTLTCQTQPYSHTQFGEIPARAYSCSDTAVDTNANGLYDYLSVEVSINSTKTMKCALGAFITSDTVFISEEEDTTTLAAGVNSVTLRFRGQDIYAAQLNGAYQITTIVYDSLETPLHSYECTTSVYNYLDFEPKKGKLKGFFDYRQDYNGNGLFEVLTVVAIVTVQETGTYRVSGWLSDADRNEIGFAEGVAPLGVGQDTIQLDFDGTLIFENAMDGPYNLSYAVLERDDGTVVDDERDGYSTNPYSYLSFERPVPPLIALTGNYSDFGQDTNGDGLYDYLTVDVEVTCSDNGVAVANARLVAPDGEEILWMSDFTPVTADVPAVISLDFDARYIFGSLQDGPYLLSDLLVYHTGDPDQSVYMSQPYTTNAYEYTAFETSAVIAGTVSDKGTPVLGALLSVQGVDYDYTNSGGDYSLTVLQGGHYTVTIEDPGGHEIDSWLIYVNGALVGEGHSVQVECTVGAVTDVDFKTSIPADVDIDPNILNLGSWGRCVTCYIELPSEYDVCDIDVSTVSFNNQVNAMLKPIEIGDYDNDGIPDLMVKFHRPSVQEILVVGDSVAVTVNGKVGTAAFEGMDTIRVIDPSPSVKGNESPGAFSLCQNYPNPFNPETKISYVLPNVCHVNISIYNLLGQRVATIVNECQTAGHRSLRWDAKDENGEQVASGVFFYRIQAGDFVQSKKMVLMK